MKFCEICGNMLIKKYLEHEGNIAFCPSCNEYRFEKYNVAVSMIVLSPDETEVLLIQQYQRKRYILVAGYVNHFESVEEALQRELKEETDLDIAKMVYQKTSFYQKTDTLMINFAVTVKNKEVHSNYEIDSYQWFSLEQAKQKIAEGSLAKEFFDFFLERKNKNEV